MKHIVYRSDFRMGRILLLHQERSNKKQPDGEFSPENVFRFFRLTAMEFLEYGITDFLSRISAIDARGRAIYLPLVRRESHEPPRFLSCTCAFLHYSGHCQGLIQRENALLLPYLGFFLKFDTEKKTSYSSENLTAAKIQP